MTADVKIPDEVIKLAESTAQFLDDATGFVIANDTQYSSAADELKSIKERSRQLDAERKAITKPMDEAKKNVMDFFRKPQKFLDDAERVLKRSMLAYQDEKRRLARIEEERIRRAQQEEQERLAKEAEEAEKAGDHETANAVIEQASNMPEAIVPSAAPEVSGVKTTTRWGAEVTDMMALVKAVAAGQVPLHALDANTKFLNQQAVSMKEAFSIPGVKAVARKFLAA